jgi:hypothetical protein
MTLAGRRLELRRDGRSAHLQINAPAESAAKMTDSLATCAQVGGRDGAGALDGGVHDNNGVITKAVPNLAVYWVKVTVAAGLPRSRSRRSPPATSASS